MNIAAEVPSAAAVRDTALPPAIDRPAEPLEPWNRRWLLLGLVLYGLSRYWMLFQLTPQITDAGLYHRFAVQGVDLGQQAYVDFPIEYPPLAWWTIAWPERLSPQRLSRPIARPQLERSQQLYHQRFHLQMAVADGAAAFCFVQLIRLRRRRYLGPLFCGYVLITACLPHLMFERLDTGLLLIFMAWAYCLARSLTGPPRFDRWRAASYVLLGVGMAYKVIPLVAVPFALLAEWPEPRRWFRLLSGAALVLASAAVPFAVQAWWAGRHVFDWTGYHAGRPIQVESLYASLLLTGWFGGEAGPAVYGHGGWNLSGHSVGVWTAASSWVLLAFAATLGLLAWRLCATRRQPVVGLSSACVALIGAVVFSKVLSPQYLVWALPLFLVAMAECWPDRTAAWCAGIVAAVVVALLSTWIFPYNYFSHLDPQQQQLINPRGLVPALSPWACRMVLSRNLLLLGLLAATCWAWWRHFAIEPTTAAGEAAASAG